MQLSRNIDLVQCVQSTSASIALEIDTADCEGVMFMGVPCTTAARIWSMALKAGATTAAFVNSASTFTHASSAAANVVLVTDVYKPAKRWIGATLSCSGANPGWMLAFKYGMRKPVATTFSATAGVSPLTGGILRAISPSSAT